MTTLEFFWEGGHVGASLNYFTNNYKGVTPLWNDIEYFGTNHIKFLLLKYHGEIEVGNNKACPEKLGQLHKGYQTDK